VPGWALRVAQTEAPQSLVVTDTNRVHLVLFGMQSRAFGPYLEC
jgi:hypothetical protein